MKSFKKQVLVWLKSRYLWPLGLTVSAYSVTAFIWSAYDKKYLITFDSDFAYQKMAEAVGIPAEEAQY